MSGERVGERGAQSDICLIRRRSTLSNVICMTHPNERERQRARRLRSSQTEAESKLWRELRAKRFDGWKFRRQHPCGPYFLDFYCARKKIAIEVDGGGHASESQSRYDKIRTEFLRVRGIKVLRLMSLLRGARGLRLA